MRLINAIVTFFYEILFGCRHEKLTRPFTLEQQTYKVCLDCGRHVFYSAETMRPLTAGEVRRMKHSHSRDNKLVPLTAQLRAKANSRTNPSVAA